MDVESCFERSTRLSVPMRGSVGRWVYGGTSFYGVVDGSLAMFFLDTKILPLNKTTIKRRKNK